MNRANKPFRIRKSAAGKVGKWYLSGFVEYRSHHGREYAHYDMIALGYSSPGEILDVLHNPPTDFAVVLQGYNNRWLRANHPPAWGS